MSQLDETRFAATAFSPHVVAAARRVADSHRLRLTDAEYAFREWQGKPTLSNAIRRDNARAALLDCSDANTVALAVLKEADHAAS